MALFRSLLAQELQVVAALSRAAQFPRLGAFMAQVSRLGNGIFWYSLIGLLACCGGPSGRETALRMLAVGALTLALYKATKAVIARPRPCELMEGFALREPPLDRWSFPSGHTMHAVSFSLVAGASFPGLHWILIPFTGLVMLSRVLLGLHYPSDVLAGTAYGILTAQFILATLGS